MVDANFQNPYGNMSPQQARLPTEQASQMEMHLKNEQTTLKTEADRRAESYSQMNELWKAGKLADNDYLGGISNLANTAFSEDERNTFVTLHQVSQQEVLKNKLAAEFDRIQAKAIDNGMSAKEVFNAVTQLGVQAAAAGLEKVSTGYFLNASLLQNQIAQDKGRFSEKKGKGSGPSTKTDFVNALNDIFN